MDGMLRVHSSDLHQHIVEQIAECFESGLYTDLVVRCKDGKMIHAHKLVLSAVSPFLKLLLEPDEDVNSSDIQTLELPEVEFNDVQLLVDVIYNGLVEATMEELRVLIKLARYLYINIPISNEMCSSLNLDLPPMPSLLPKIRVKKNLTQDRSSPPSMPRVKNNLSSSGPPKLTQLLSAPPPLKRFKPDKTVNNTMPNLDMKLPLPASMMPTAPLPIQTISANNSKEYRCPLCNSVYNNLGNFKQHMRFHENENMKEQRAALLNSVVSACYDPDSQRYNCEICNSFYTHPGNFKQHLGKHERESGAVTALFNQKNGLPPEAGNNVLNGNNGHLSNVLQNAMADKMDEAEKLKYQYHCDICGRSFKHPGNFKQHMASHMRSVTYSKSTIVNGVVAANDEAQRAQQILQNQLQLPPSISISTPDTGSSINKCDICDDIFETKALLLNHKENHHTGNPLPDANNSDIANLYQCDEPGCLQSFSKEGWLQRHKQRDHVAAISVYENASGGGKVYACRTCGKEFRNSSKLSAHMRVHRPDEDHYKYPCDICGKKFTRPQHVTRHKLLHTGEKPFFCFKCKRTFNREDKLKEHQKFGCDSGLDPLQEQNDQSRSVYDEEEDYFAEDEDVVQVELNLNDVDDLDSDGIAEAHDSISISNTNLEEDESNGYEDNSVVKTEFQ